MSIPHPLRFGVTVLGAPSRQEWIDKVHKVEDLSYSVLQRLQLLALRRDAQMIIRREPLERECFV